MSEFVEIDIDQEELEILRDALDILSPDSVEAAEKLELFNQRILYIGMEVGTTTLELDGEEVMFAIDALDIVQPDDFTVQDTAMHLGNRLREAALGHEEIPGM